MRIFSVLPRPVSPLVNPPPGGCTHSHAEAHKTPGTPPGYISTHASKKNAVERPQNATQRTPAKTAPTQHEPKHRHRTRAAIQDYTLQQPGRSSRPQGSPNGDPQTAPQTAGTPPGCNGVAPQTEAAHSGAQAAQRATENAPSRSPERCALFIHFQQVSEDHERKN